MAEADAFYTFLGRRVHDLRRSRGLTQEELGSRLTPRMTRASIANIEAGKQGVLSHTLAQFASTLGVNIQDLVPTNAPIEVKPGLRAEVQDELGKKLTLSAETSRRLAEKLLPEKAGRRKKKVKNERSARTSRR